MPDRPYNRALATMRLTATYALIALLLVFARPRPAGVALGFAIVALGEAIRLWAAGHLLKTKELVTSGPYRYTRNPLYLGRLLIFTGLCVMASLPYGVNWAILLVGYAVFFGYYPHLRGEFDALFPDFYAVLTPATVGTAPPVDTTGDPSFCTLWTLLGLPCISLPLMTGPDGLPLGVQLVGPRAGDARLLRTARWLVDQVQAPGTAGVARRHARQAP